MSCMILENAIASSAPIKREEFASGLQRVSSGPFQFSTELLCLLNRKAACFCVTSMMLLGSMHCWACCYARELSICRRS